MKRKSLTHFVLIVLFSFFGVYQQLVSQTSISIVPPECYPGVSASAQDATAASSNGASPFATWKAAYDYAHTGAGSGTVMVINFAPGYYSTNLSGFRAHWGDADGGFVLKSGITVNGNGAVIDNTGAGSSVICFATMGTNSILDGFTFIDFTGNVSGGAISAQSATGWQVNNCNFDGNDKGGGSGMEISGGSGTLSGCNFYKHLFTTGSAMDISGGTTILNDCTFSCNYRDNNGGRGGAIYMTGGTATFNDCVFDGNEAGGNAPGGAMSIESGASATFNNTVFTCNEANTLTDQDGGALNCESGSTVTITGCTFTGNIAKRQGGAIRSAGGSSSSVNLTVSNSTFTNNATNTSSSKGGAIYLYNTITNLNGNFFSGNTVTGEGGAVYVAHNQSGNVATYDFSSNTMSSNTAGDNQCKGKNVFTEMHIGGSNNMLDALADGWHATNPTNTGTLEFNTTTASLNTTINANGYTGIPVATSFGSTNYWVFNGYTASSVTGFDAGQRGMAYVLAANGSNFATADGYAVLFWRPGGSGNRKLSFVSFAGGLDGNANISVIQELGNFGSNTSGSFTCKAVNDGSAWKFYVSVSGSDITGEDPRGYNYCNPTVTVTGALSGANTHRGIWVSNSSTSNFYTYSKNYFRNTDETLGSGGSGSGVSASCAGCPASPTASSQCPVVNTGSIQGDVFLDGNNDGIMNAGEQRAGVVVELVDKDGNPILDVNGVAITTTTDVNGHYIFTGLSTGKYRVRFGVPAGYSSATSTIENSGAPTFDSDVPSGTGPTFLSPEINLDTNTGMSNGNDAFTGAANYYNVTAGYSALVLPVTWSSMSVKNNNCENIISWTTESETNNDYFVVESSKDGKEYGQVKMIEGQGDKRSQSKYSYNHPLKSSGVTYYRIKQVDYDGRYSYSSVIKSRNKACAELSYLSVYPNPAMNESVNLEFSEIEKGEEVSIQVYNNIGQLQLNNTFVADDNIQQKPLDISTLQSGVYIIKVCSSGGSLFSANVKFIKI
jgi:predicted outer membrane repeat protein